MHADQPFFIPPLQTANALLVDNKKEMCYHRKGKTL